VDVRADTAAPRRTHRAILRVETHAQTEFIDLTDRLRALVAGCALDCGLVHVQTCHTTMGLLINEAEPLLLEDLAERLAQWAPSSIAYRHDDVSRRAVNVGPGERTNGFAHCRAALVGATESLQVIDGELCLGRWQRLLLAEFDGPQPRAVSVMLVDYG
jgi:secondary thiamine-phosphate synthase enzyme